MTRLVPILITLLLLACKPSPPPAPPKSAPVLIVTVGGLSSSQLGEVNTLIVDNFPTAAVGFFGPENGWMGDLPAYLAAPHGTLICIGHSYGGDMPWGKCGPIRLLILLDPVEQPGHGGIVIPANVEKCIVFRAGIGTPGIVPAKVSGKFNEVTIHRSHNMLPHDAGTLWLIHCFMEASFE